MEEKMWSTSTATGLHPKGWDVRDSGTTLPFLLGEGVGSPWELLPFCLYLCDHLSFLHLDEVCAFLCGALRRGA